MLIPGWVANLAVAFVLFGAVFILIYFLNMVINDFLKYRLRERLKKGLFHDDLTLSDFRNLQNDLNLSDKNAHSALLHMKSKLDYSDDEGRNVLKPKLDSLITEFNTSKPFSELPTGLVKPLFEAKENSHSPQVIDNLAEKILIHLKRKKRMEVFLMFVTFAGFILTILSFLPGSIK